MSEVDRIRVKIAEVEQELKAAKDAKDRDMVLALNNRLTGLEEDLRRKETSTGSGIVIIREIIFAMFTLEIY